MTPDAAMMAPVEALGEFMTSRADGNVPDCFADDVTIVENFHPHVFRGPDAVNRWCDGFRKHAATLSGLVVRFGEAQDFSSDGETAYFVLPTTWTGCSHGQPFEEEGGWAFVLKRQGQSWRIACYAWAVTSLRRV